MVGAELSDTALCPPCENALCPVSDHRRLQEAQARIDELEALLVEMAEAESGGNDARWVAALAAVIKAGQRLKGKAHA